MVIVNQIKCKACGGCVDSCPIGAIAVVQMETDSGSISVAQIDSDVCGNCGYCIDRCPSMAISLAGDQKIKRPPKQ
jgi:formate hydrogenlyase subunit 6/NADH:ubiquinone oxidoreductase subunit I